MNRHWQIRRVTGAPLVVPSWLTNVAGLEGLSCREQAQGIEAGSLFFTDPDCRVDPWLTRYLTRSSFAWLAAETRRNYATDYCVFFDFLWSRGKNWNEAGDDDVWDFQHWRRRSPSNPRVISGNKWNRELAALNRLYRWAVAQGVMAKSPVTERVRLTREGDLVSVPAGWAHEVWACPGLTDIRDQETWGLREDVQHHGERGEEAVEAEAGVHVRVQG